MFPYMSNVGHIGKRLRARRDLLAAEDGCDREKPLASIPLVLVIVDEFECPFPKIQDRNIRRCADTQCSAAGKNFK